MDAPQIVICNPPVWKQRPTEPKLSDLEHGWHGQWLVDRHIVPWWPTWPAPTYKLSAPCFLNLDPALPVIRACTQSYKMLPPINHKQDQGGFQKNKTTNAFSFQIPTINWSFWRPWHREGITWSVPEQRLFSIRNTFVKIYFPPTTGWSRRPLSVLAFFASKPRKQRKRKRQQLSGFWSDPENPFNLTIFSSSSSSCFQNSPKIKYDKTI